MPNSPLDPLYVCTKHKFRSKGKAALQLHVAGSYGCELTTTYPQPAPFPARRPDSEAVEHTFEFSDVHPSEQQYGSINLIIGSGNPGNGSHRVSITQADLIRLHHAVVAERRRQQARRSDA